MQEYQVERCNASFLSFTSQYYKKLIQENSEWEFVGVYADEALMNWNQRIKRRVSTIT